MTDKPTASFVIAGAGPVGLAMALLLADGGHSVRIVESHDAPSPDVENSYPIGVNPRGRATLERIDPDLVAALQQHAQLVSAWQIYVGSRRVARLPGGSVVSTTRAYLTYLLWQQACQHPRIDITTHAAVSQVDLDRRQLVVQHDDHLEHIDLTGVRLIAADGVGSAVRECLQSFFTPEVNPWGVHFRVLLSQAQPHSPMDPSVHYIFGGQGLYAATVGDGRWCVALTVREDSAESEFLLAESPTEENVRRLADYVDRHAPLTRGLFTTADYEAFFTRNTFTGAVVHCSQLHVGEDVVLLGDAAHAVIPPTGEGVNSGLEDCLLLAEWLERTPESTFTNFSAARLPDVAALTQYAEHLRDDVHSTDPLHNVTGAVLRIVNTIRARCGHPTAQVEAALFGPAAERTGYEEILRDWLRQRDKVFPRLYRLLSGIRGLIPGSRRSRRHLREGTSYNR